MRVYVHESDRDKGMSRGASLLEKRDLADKLLAYLASQPDRSWDNSHDIICQAAKSIEDGRYEVFEYWKCFTLLRQLGRIVLNNPNGRHGFRLIDRTPLTMPGIQVVTASTHGVVLDIMRHLATRYPIEFRAAVKELTLP